MNILTIAMGIFVCLELMNVAMLYFTPGARRGNGIGVFNAWEKSKENDEVHWRPYNSTVCRGGDDTIHTHVFLEAVSDDTNCSCGLPTFSTTLKCVADRPVF